MSVDETRLNYHRHVAAGRTVRTTLVAAGMLTACVAVLSIAGWLKPDPRGYGTHQQLGASPCGMLLVSGLPCPTCGMTTSFSHTVRGQFVSAFQAQPGGLVLALLTVGATGVALFAVIRGRWPAWRWERLTPGLLLALTLLIFVGGWGFKLLVGLWSGTLPVDRVAL